MTINICLLFLSNLISVLSLELIELPIIGDETNTHEVSLEVVHNVIFARVEETLMILAQFIENSGLKEQMGAGVILTGGLGFIGSNLVELLIKKKMAIFNELIIDILTNFQRMIKRGRFSSMKIIIREQLLTQKINSALVVQSKITFY